MIFKTFINIFYQHYSSVSLNKNRINIFYYSNKLAGQSDQSDRNLSLTIDWNCEDLARKMIFERDVIKINHNIFKSAILRFDREQFVELFLEQGFCIHQFLNRERLRELFEKTEKRDFFVQVILQGMFGHINSSIPEDFFPSGLNKLLKKLTSIAKMLSTRNVSDPRQLEKNALNLLIIHAVLMNRHKLAKIFWKRCEDPIPVRM